MKKILFVLMALLAVSCVAALSYRFPLGNIDAYGNNITNVTTATFTTLNILSPPATCSNYSNYFMTYFNGSTSTCSPVNVSALGNLYQNGTTVLVGGPNVDTGYDSNTDLEVQNNAANGIAGITANNNNAGGYARLCTRSNSADTCLYLNGTSTNAIEIEYENNKSSNLTTDAVWIASGFRPVARATAPTGVFGYIYTDSTGALCWYNGTAWHNLDNRTADALCA